MKVSADDKEIIIYLNSYYIENVDFLDAYTLEKYMNDLFKNLKNIYNIKLNGYYNIDIYIDNIYGAIIHMEKEEIEYYDCFDDQIDTQISIHSDAKFLYKIEDFFGVSKYLDNNYSLYKYNNELYIKLNENIDKYKLGNILENTIEICYDIEKIIKTNNLLFDHK